MHTNPSAFAYPTISRSTGALVLAAASASGEALARGWAPTGAQARLVAREIRRVEFSLAALEQIESDLRAQMRARALPDFALVHQSGPDPDLNRIVIAIDRRSDALLRALAQRYGTRAIAIRIEQRLPWQLVSRDADTPPFWGGAKINKYGGGSCSDAFSMRNGFEKMLTAGHCWPTQSISDGTTATVSTPASAMGYIPSLAATNYDKNIGTVIIPGQGSPRGDVALIHVTQAGGVAGYMYRGPAGSGSFAPVKETHGWAFNGQLFCTGGTSTGEQCNWQVYALRTTQYDGPNQVGPVTLGSRTYFQTCLQGGDSGGPAYTVRGDGGIAAKGVLSLAGGGFPNGDCTVAFTEIQDALAAFPGAYVVIGQ